MGGECMKRTRIIAACCLIIALIGLYIGGKVAVHKFRALEAENTKLQQQIQFLQQDKAGYTEGKYTLITNLSSSIYLNRIPAKYDNTDRWEDVNGVKFFDVTIDGTHYRYVEGHIEMPQLALYAPNLHLELVSEKEVGQ
jgi:hypothetical protein